MYILKKITKFEIKVYKNQILMGHSEKQLINSLIENIFQYLLGPTYTIIL